MEKIMESNSYLQSLRVLPSKSCQNQMDFLRFRNLEVWHLWPLQDPRLPGVWPLPLPSWEQPLQQVIVIFFEVEWIFFCIMLFRRLFNNYLDKMRGSKSICFCPRSGYKSCPRNRRGEGGKKWQYSVHDPRSCWMTPRVEVTKQMCFVMGKQGHNSY